MRQLWVGDDRLVVSYDGGALCAYDEKLQLTEWYDGDPAGWGEAWQRMTRRRPPRSPLALGEEVVHRARHSFVHHGDAVAVIDNGRESWLVAPTDADYEAWGAASLVVQPVSWSGRAGEWTVQTRLWNAGDDGAGLTLSAVPNAFVALHRGVLDGVEAGDGRGEGKLVFAGVSLAHNRPTTLVLSGRAERTCELLIRASTRRHQIAADTRPEITRTEVDDVRLGEFVVRIEVKAAPSWTR